MYFETELSDKLNNELESAGVSVSEALIAKTLAAVQAARAAEEDASEAEWIEATEENASKLIELASARKRSLKKVAPILSRVATVMAACFVLVVGGFVLRFSTMRMGEDTAERAQAPMMTAESGSARSDMKADADASGAADIYMYYSETSESLEMESAVAADTPIELIVPTAESDVADDAVVEEMEAETPEMQEVKDAANVLTVQLERAESVELEYTAQGTAVYRFVVRETDGSAVCYLVHENGRVECAELMSDGETGAVMQYDSADGKAFQRAVLVWMKQNGYGF